MSDLPSAIEPAARSIRSIAFYLPQFHPIPENDEWWGPGYTEWRRVVRARPQFSGHHQPQLPSELGFYDLRVPEVRHAQADLARAHGIDAFCYYHYWFSGRRLLERPFEEVLASREPSIPFLLCWANEPWTRTWDGHEHRVLLDQQDLPEDAERFALDLLPALSDPRYVHVHGRPLLLVYRANLMSDPRRSTDVWRSVVTRHGLPEPYLARVESLPDERGDPRAIGFDGAVEFQPDWSGIEEPRTPTGLIRSARRKLRSLRTVVRNHRVVGYDEVVAYALAKDASPYPRSRGVTPGWDNTARRARGATIIVGSNPLAYEAWVHETARRAVAESTDPLLFVNAWNEWGEGSHLEPGEPEGRAFLDAHRRAVTISVPSSFGAPPSEGLG